MQYPIPQFIEVEDQVIGPLTIKQFLYLLAGGVFLLIAWSFADLELFIFIAVLTALVVVPLAFIKPYGRPLTHYLSSVLQFILRPKIRTWHKTTKKAHIKAYDIKTKKEATAPIKVGEKKFEVSKIQELAKKLDFQASMPTETEKGKKKE